MTDLVQQKTYEERLHMRNNLLAFRITKGKECYVGTAREIAKILDSKADTIQTLSLYTLCPKGWSIERVGVYKKVIGVYKDNELEFSDYIEEVAKELCTTSLRIAQCCNHDLLIQGMYSIKFDGDFDLVEMEV